MPIYDEDERAERRRQRDTGIPDPLDGAINDEFNADVPAVPPVGANDPRSQIGGAYEQYLGRKGSDEEIASHMGRGYNLGASLSNIQGSQEAKNYAAAQKKLKDKPPTDPGIPPPTNAPQTNTPPGQRNESYDYIPGTENIAYGDTSRLSGFNTNEWGPGGTEGYDEFSYKNIFGKVATRYEPSPDGVRQLVNDPDFKRAFPRAVLIDHPTDPKIKFEPGDPPVDVLAASGAGGWQWLPEGEGGGAPAAGGVPPDDTDTGDGSDTITNVDQLGNNDILADIQRALAAAGRGEQPYLSGAITKAFR